MRIALNLRSEETERAIRALRSKAPFAIARALNRSISSGRTAMTRLIDSDLGIGQAYVRERIVVREADPRAAVPTASLVASAKRIPVIAFGASPKLPPSRGQGRGVSWRSQGRRVRDPQAFVAQMRSGHIGVFKREGEGQKRSPRAWSKNLPIKELRQASIAHVFTKHVAVGIARAQEQLVKNLQHELRFALSK